MPAPPPRSRPGNATNQSNQPNQNRREPIRGTIGAAATGRATAPAPAPSAKAAPLASLSLPVFSTQGTDHDSQRNGREADRAHPRGAGTDREGGEREAQPRRRPGRPDRQDLRRGGRAPHPDRR